MNTIYFFVVGNWYVWSVRNGGLLLYGVWRAGFEIGKKKRGK